MRLHFKDFGSGPPLVILHGLFGSSDNWLGVAPKLAEHFRVFVLDLRNHGQSPHSARMNYGLMAGDLVEFLDAEGFEKAHVMGHSMGGKVAMQFALSHPARVQKLIVVDMAPRLYEGSHQKIIAALLALDLQLFQTRQQIEDVLAPAIPSQVVRRFLLKNLGRDATGKFFWKINLNGVAENYPILGEAISAQNPFTNPVLFLRGGKSDFVRATDEPEIRRLFPRAHIETIAASGHWVHADKPAEFAGAVLKFLREN